MTPFILKPNQDYRTSLPRQPINQNIRSTNFAIHENDIILEGIRPLQELCLNVSMTAKGKLCITNFGQVTVTLVEMVATARKLVPVLTEIRSTGSIDIQHYVDFTHRYFSFLAFTPDSNEPKVVKLGINVTSNDKILYLEYKIL